MGSGLVIMDTIAIRVSLSKLYGTCQGMSKEVSFLKASEGGRSMFFKITILLADSAHTVEGNLQGGRLLSHREQKAQRSPAST